MDRDYILNLHKTCDESLSQCDTLLNYLSKGHKPSAFAFVSR